MAEAAGQYDLRPAAMRAYQDWCLEWAAEALRVAKPGAYLLAFGGTRTVHRMTCAIEDAGWIIRDMLVWGYASGFPKGRANLKPAWEPIVMARKPGPLRALAIDACRITTTPAERDFMRATSHPNGTKAGGAGGTILSVGDKPDGFEPNDGGRWPANIVLTDPIFDGGWEGVVGGGWQESTSVPGAWAPRGAFPIDNPTPTIYGDSGTYSRFFLIPKAARSDREPVLGGLPLQPMHLSGGRVVNTSKGDGTGIRENRPRANLHPTVKPVDLMRHLVRLVTPPGGTVLDPFLGSGTTALAAEMEGFAWIGIEKEASYVEIAEARLNGTQKGMAL
jgi:site-specific DNA-methyltransferase (adenine-specific)